MSLSTHVLIRITLVGLLCWVGVSLALIWRLQHQGQTDGEAQADRLKVLTEQQLHRQLIAIDAGTRDPDLARVAANFGRPVCLRYKGYDVSHASSWGCGDHDPEGHAAPGWFGQLLIGSGALPRQVQRTITLWSTRDGTLTVEPLVIDDLWHRLRDLAMLTAATIGAVNVGVWFTLRRLLRPTQGIQQALDRLAAGDVSTRLAPSGPREFRHIARHVDDLRRALAGLTAQRNALTARLIDSQETERRDVARDLHDEMGQGLAAMQAISGSIRMSARALEPARTDDTESLDDTIEQLHSGLRALLGRLRPPLLDSQGLAFALRELVQAWNARQRLAAPAPLHAVLTLPEDQAATEANLPEAVSLAFYRAAQEALTNAARYAEPSRPVMLALSRHTGAGLALVVSSACTEEPRPSRGTGLGLAMLAGRLQSVGGSLNLDRTDTRSFELRAVWPAAPTATGWIA